MKEEQLNTLLLEKSFIEDRIQKLAKDICKEQGHIDPLNKYSQFKGDDDYESIKKKNRKCERCDGIIKGTAYIEPYATNMKSISRFLAEEIAL